MAPPHSEHEPGSLLRARSRLAAGRRRNNMPARFAIADARCREIPSSRAASERATFAAAIALSCFVHFPVACSLWNSIPWRFARAVARWREIPSTRAASARESPFAPGPPTGEPTPRFRPARARRRSRCARRSPPHAAAKAPGSRCVGHRDALGGKPRQLRRPLASHTPDPLRTRSAACLSTHSPQKSHRLVSGWANRSRMACGGSRLQVPRFGNSSSPANPENARAAAPLAGLAALLRLRAGLANLLSQVLSEPERPRHCGLSKRPIACARARVGSL